MKIRFVDSKWLVLPAVALTLFVCHPQARGATMFSDANDGFLEVRDNLPPQSPWPQIHGDTFGSWRAGVGEWYGSGLTTIVLPFGLPDLGAVSNPFLSANFGVQVFQIGAATVTDIDLYAVRVSPNPAIATTDWYNGAAFDPTATLIQGSFLTPTSPGGSGGSGSPNNFTDATGDANLLGFLNTAYADGAGAGQFVFLRLSYGSDTFASGWDAYNITVREAGGQGEWPVITYTSVPEPGAAALAALGSALLLGYRSRRNAARA